MHPNEQLITNFYNAFKNKDSAGMAACYHDEIHFSDPVFPDLKGWQAKAMWQMLCERAQDLEVTFRDVKADDSTGSAHWDAVYTFGKTGRKVHNSIDATFTFKDGRIIDHRDSFGLWRWTRMAMGATGVFMGWLPSVQNKIRKESATGLEMFAKRKRLAPK
ncbi:MAG: nuclear transport factor 2 family protein [Spirochaetia bacterium]|nr:nuclear transport factor 2 family protein [Spirochaetia bacterium]